MEASVSFITPRAHAFVGLTGNLRPERRGEELHRDGPLRASLWFVLSCLRLSRVARAGPDLAQPAGESRLVHGLHALPGGDLSGAPLALSRPWAREMRLGIAGELPNAGRSACSGEVSG